MHQIEMVSLDQMVLPCLLFLQNVLIRMGELNGEIVLLEKSFMRVRRSFLILSMAYDLNSQKLSLNYNSYRPHFSLKGATPLDYIRLNYSMDA